MLSMFAGLLAAYSCLGCIPMEEALANSDSSVRVSQHEATTLSIRSDADYFLTDSANPAAARIHSGPSAFSPSNWPLTAQLATLKAQAETTPEPVRIQKTEQFTAQWTFMAESADTGLGLDMAVAPRATFEKNGEKKTARAGAEVRLGQNLADAVDRRGTYDRVDSWYMFAATDGEALCWDVGDKGASFDGVALRDQVTVGDVQAGVAFHRAGGELSVGYVRREVSFEGMSAVDEFAAVSFTMRK